MFLTINRTELLVNMPQGYSKKRPSMNNYALPPAPPHGLTTGGIIIFILVFSGKF